MQVAKWGNSLAVRLPKALVEKMGLKLGDEVSISSSNDRALEVTKADQRRAAFERMKAAAIILPADYRFDRDDANAR